MVSRVTEARRDACALTHAPPCASDGAGVACVVDTGVVACVACVVCHGRAKLLGGEVGDGLNQHRAARLCLHAPTLARYVAYTLNNTLCLMRTYTLNNTLSLMHIHTFVHAHGNERDLEADEAATVSQDPPFVDRHQQRSYENTSSPSRHCLPGCRAAHSLSMSLTPVRARGPIASCHDCRQRQGERLKDLLLNVPMTNDCPH